MICGQTTPPLELKALSAYTVICLNSSCYKHHMNKYLILPMSAIALLAHSLPCYAVDAKELAVSRLGDVELSCGELSQEAALMRDIVMTTEDIKDNTSMKTHGITAAGAVGSFLVGTVTGGVGIAAAGFLLKNTTQGEKQDADNVQDIAEQRRSLMMGIYHAKGCAGPIEHVMQDGIEKNSSFFELASSDNDDSENSNDTVQATYNQ